MHSTTCARLPHRVACPPPTPFVPSANLSGRPAPMAGQSAAPQLAISVLAAPPRHAKAKKIAAPPQKNTKNSYIRVHPRKFVHPFSYIFSAVGGLRPNSLYYLIFRFHKVYNSMAKVLMHTLSHIEIQLIIQPSHWHGTTNIHMHTLTAGPEGHTSC